MDTGNQRDARQWPTPKAAVPPRRVPGEMPPERLAFCVGWLRHCLAQQPRQNPYCFALLDELEAEVRGRPERRRTPLWHRLWRV